MEFKAGFIAIVGRSNAGKSTLVNKVVGRKVAIVSTKVQTTRNRIQGIVNRDDAQIVLIDTPGLHRAGSALGRQMMSEARQALEGVDILSLIVDAAVEFGVGDRAALDWIKRFRGPVFLLLNKVDRMPKEKLLPLIDHYQREREFAEIFPISALTGDGVPELVKSWISYLPENPAYFPADQFTDQPERFIAGEFVREKLIAATREELPHSVAVLVDTFEESEKLVHIRATIFVEREGQKGIVIGKGGELLKKAGTDARREIENLLGVKVFLELFVKVQPNWRQSSGMVRQLDWHQQMENMSVGEDGDGEELDGSDEFEDGEIEGDEAAAESDDETGELEN